MKIKQNIFLISILLMSAFVFSACGNNNATPNISTQNDSSTSQDDDATPEQTSQDEIESEQEQTPQDEAAPPQFSERQLKITLDDTEVVYATLVDNSIAVDLFIEQLPFTIDMDTYINRNKRGPLPFVIEDSDLHNIRYPFEIGDIIYYPPGPLLGIFYDHNDAEISAGYELMARMDEEGIKAFAEAPANLKVTVELAE